MKNLIKQIAEAEIDEWSLPEAEINEWLGFDVGEWLGLEANEWPLPEAEEYLAMKEMEIIYD